MTAQGWQETLAWASGDGTALTNTVTATSIIPAAARFVLPAGFVNHVGKTFRITAKGRMSNVVTTPGNLTLDIRMGGTVVFNGGAIAMNTTAKTNVTWWYEAEIVCRAIGTTGNFLGIGQIASESMLGGAANTFATAYNLPVSSPVVGSNVDLTTALAVDMFATFSVASASNSITVHTYKLESMN